ncbi:MAG: NADH:flavin oxidoreductase [Pseudomonadota bacterium]
MTQTLSPQAEKDPLLQPFQLKALTLRNRIMSTAHACGLGDESHMPGETYQRYHLEKARGGLALTMFGGSSYVANDSLWASGQLNMATDDVIPHLRQFAERIHDEGAALMIQITHLGRRAEALTQNWAPAIAPSAIREIGHRAIPREMTEDDVQRVVRQLGEAARRAQAGGLDGVEIMAHGHLVGQFLSPATNKRSDRYGGSLENRCRFALMVFEEVRRNVGDAFIFGLRFGVDESASGGSDFDESVRIAQLFEREGHLDFINANCGRIDTELGLATECMPGMSMPLAPWLTQVARFKREIALPVFHAAKIADIATARHAIREGLLDMVAMTRAHIADPYIVDKIARGEENRIRPCVGASVCMGENRPTCLHNQAAGRERRWPQRIQTTSGPTRKIVVVGGGPAGLEAARISAERGHEIVLFEAGNALGGQLRLATGTDWRKDLHSIIDWRANELDALGVDVRLNTLVEDETVRAEAPDVIIIATGGVPSSGWVEGAELCTDPWDVLTGAVRPAGRVLLYDGSGRHAGPSLAMRLVGDATSLDYVMVDDVLAKELAYAERVIWRKSFAEHGIHPVSEHTLVSVRRAGNALEAVMVSELTGEISVFEADMMISEFGTIPVEDVFQSLQSHASNRGETDMDALFAGDPQPCLEKPGPSLFRIGDAVASRNAAAAMYDALRLCSPM